MRRMTLVVVIALTVLIWNNECSSAETAATVQERDGIVEQPDAITSRLDAIEHQLAKKRSLSNGTELPDSLAPLASLTEELLERIAERANLNKQCALVAEAVREHRSPQSEYLAALSKVRDNEYRIQRTILAIQSFVELKGSH